MIEQQQKHDNKTTFFISIKLEWILDKKEKNILSRNISSILKFCCVKYQVILF